VSLFVPPRRPSRELLDDPSLPDSEMRLSLADIDFVHRHWRGSRSLWRHIAARVRAPDRPVTILDVGAGSGTVARRLRTSLSLSGPSLSGAAGNPRVTALDVQWRHLAAGRASSAPDFLPLVAADAFHLPFPDRAFDFAVSTLFFHHFSPDENRSILAELLRVARSGFAVLDLRRHRVALAAIAAAGPFFFRSRVSVLDGIASVRQAYTTAEAQAIAGAVSPTARAVRVFPCGLLVTADR
jgi:ubiquinone/menaquinone biosynthesis C-methylase UbiE